MDEFNTARSLSIMTNICVIDHDSEFADISNPRGEIHGFSAHVVLDGADGSRWEHQHATTARWEDQVIRQAKPLLEHMRARMAYEPLNQAYWREIQPVYGSAAYQAGQWEADMAAQDCANDF